MLSLFAYVDGSDLAEVERQLVGQLHQFVRDWGVPTARVINDRFERTADLRDEDLPIWNLGLNFEVENLPRLKVEALVGFLSKLAKDSEREFVIGHWDAVRRISEDWCSIGAEPKPEAVEFLAAQVRGDSSSTLTPPELSRLSRYPDVSGPPRSYVAPLLIVLAIGGIVYTGYWWYLQGLESDCRHRCLTTGHNNYRYVEPTGSAKHFRQGTCSCMHEPAAGR